MKKLILISLLPLCLFWVSCSQGGLSGKRQPKAINGVLDLSDWDFEKDGMVRLDGEWEFYWKQLLSPENLETLDLAQKTEFVHVPSSWNTYDVESKKAEEYGYATFKIKIKLKKAGNYGIKNNSMSTAYRLWINGNVALSVGKVGKNVSDMIPKYQSQVKTFHSDSTLHIIVHVSNYQHKRGGIWDTIYLGHEKQVLQSQKNALAFDLFLVGSLLIMALYHFGLFLLRRKDKTTIYFGIYCFLLFLRVLMTGEHYVNMLFLNFPWQLMVKIEYFSFYAGIPIFTSFFRNLYPDEFSKLVYQIFLSLGAFLSLSILPLPFRVYAPTLLLAQILLLLFIIYTLYVLIKAIFHKRIGSAGILFGFSVLTITLINDILYSNEIIFTGHYAPLGLFIFIFGQAFILSLRSSKAFTSVERLSATFQKFVPSKFLDRIAKEGIESIEVGNAESDNITVLFSDIRDFTSISEKMSPEELLSFLNAYFKEMNQVIHENNGFIDKFIGDAIMALYDHPELTNQDEAVDAVKSAVSMQKALLTHNQHQQNRGNPAISIGIGIHSGKAVIGTVGSIDRMDSTVLGDVVNVASRLESLTKYYKTKIIISSNTWKLLPLENDNFLWRKLDYIAVKGKKEAIDIYEIFNSDPDEIKEKKKKILKPYHKALTLFYSRQWTEAIKLFDECLIAYREDHIANMYLERCLQFKENPPPQDWKGVLKMEAK